MKITNEQLRRIIKEEIEAVLEAPFRGDMTVGADPIHRQERSQGGGSSFHRDLDNQLYSDEKQSPRQKGHLVLAQHRDKGWCLVFPSEEANAGRSKFVELTDLTGASPAIKQMFQGVSIPTDSAELNLANFNAEGFNQELKRLYFNGCLLGDVTQDKVFYEAGFDFSPQDTEYQPLGRCRKAEQATTLDL